MCFSSPIGKFKARATVEKYIQTNYGDALEISSIQYRGNITFQDTQGESFDFLLREKSHLDEDTYSQILITLFPNNVIYDGYQDTYDTLLTQSLNETIDPIVTNTLLDLGYGYSNFITTFLTQTFVQERTTPQPLEAALKTSRFDAVIFLPVEVENQAELEKISVSLLDSFQENSAPLGTIIFLAFEKNADGSAYHTRVSKNGALLDVTDKDYISVEKGSSLYHTPAFGVLADRGMSFFGVDTSSHMYSITP